jgi:hypothetical protein
MHNESTVREYRVESRESARAQSREGGAQCTMRAQFERAEATVQRRECRVESTESARMQTRECRECEYAESECRVESAESARMQSTESAEARTESRVQRARECRVERREHSAR